MLATLESRYCYFATFTQPTLMVASVSIRLEQGTFLSLTTNRSTESVYLYGWLNTLLLQEFDSYNLNMFIGDHPCWLYIVWTHMLFSDLQTEIGSSHSYHDSFPWTIFLPLLITVASSFPNIVVYFLWSLRLLFLSIEFEFAGYFLELRIDFMSQKYQSVALLIQK